MELLLQSLNFTHFVDPCWRHGSDIQKNWYTLEFLYVAANILDSQSLNTMQPKKSCSIKQCCWPLSHRLTQCWCSSCPISGGRLRKQVDEVIEVRSVVLSFFVRVLQEWTYNERRCVTRVWRTSEHHKWVVIRRMFFTSSECGWGRGQLNRCTQQFTPAPTTAAHGIFCLESNK